jgi:hypothetical protein
MDERHLNAKASITNIAAEWENDRWKSIRKPAKAHYVSHNTVHATLQKDLQLSKKLVRWAIKLLYEEMKKE